MNWTLLVATLGVILGGGSLGWQIWDSTEKRKSQTRPEVVATISGGDVGALCLATFVNTSPAHARHVQYLILEQSVRYSNAVGPSANLSPNETLSPPLEFPYRAGRTTMVWAWLDTKGNVYGRNMDGRTLRFKKEDARSKNVTLDSIFTKLYPLEPLPVSLVDPIRMWE
jgi:hypothetical protein